MDGSFDGLRYIASYPDLIAVFGTDSEAGRRHYEAFGRAEGRDPLRFDPITYGAGYSDLIRAFGSDAHALAFHYVRFGFSEGRAASGFDAIAYAASYPDLIRAFGADARALTLHYVRFGFLEGRSSGDFDALGYAAANSDLARAYGDNIDALARHYVRWGWGEGRSTTGFDPAAYAALYPDLENAFGSDLRALVRHYVVYGINEGRLQATAIGTAAADLMQGGASRDVIAGRAGDDHFVATAGGDYYFGGSGIDKLDYSAFADPVTLDRSPGTSGLVRHIGGEDALFSIEALILTAGADRVTLDVSPDVIYGGAGNDQILGRGGGDRLYGGAGDDLISGFALDASVPEGFDRLFGEDGHDTLITGLHGGAAHGGNGNDFFIVRAALLGRAAPVVVEGGDGIDSLTYSAGTEIVIRPDGSATFSDRLNGGIHAIVTGVEYLSLLPFAPSASSSLSGEGMLPLSLNLGRGSHSVTGLFSTDGAASHGLTLEHGHQTIDATINGSGRVGISASGSTNTAWIRGTATIEYSVFADSNLRLGQGDDRFVLYGGTSALDGGGGIDSVWVIGGGATRIDLVAGTISGGTVSATLAGIESATGSELDDVIIGNDEANILRGHFGHDRIYGGGTGSDGRFDILIGASGDDLLVGGAGYDSLRGQEGADILVDRADGSFSGDEGDDLIVVLLDDPALSAGHIAYVDGDAGADLFVISSVVGTYGELLLRNYSRSEGDRIDLSDLRDTDGAILDLGDLVSAASTDPNGVRLSLDGFRGSGGATLSGSVLIYGITSPSDFADDMFFFHSGIDWRALVPADWTL